MIEKNRIASIIDTLIEECGECPLERICNEDECTHVWERFLEAKVKEDGVEIEEQKSYEVDHAQNYNKTLEHDADIIRKQINAGWIPVEEQLPEEDGFYIATIDGEIAGQEESFVGLAEFEDDFWVDDDIDYKCIIAWRPLPEPYRPEKEEQKNDRE